MTKPRRKVVRIGPADHGRRMSLDEFDRAVAREGYFYELNKGVVDVSGLPLPSHAMQLDELREQFGAYRRADPGVIVMIGGGGEAKMLIESVQSGLETTAGEVTRGAYR